MCVWARVSAAPRHSWLGCWAVSVLLPRPLLATGARCGCVCLGSGFGCAPPLLAGVLGCVCAPLAPSHSWPRVRGVGACVWARVSAAPRHSWLGCWALCVLRFHPATPGSRCAVWVCVFGLGFRLLPATPGWGVELCVCSACIQPLLATGARCGCVCLGSGFGCAPPLLAGLLGCVCALLAPSHSWPRVRGVDVCVWARVSAAPRHSWLGCWAVCVLRLHPATPGHGCALWVCGCLGSGFGCAPPLLAWVLGCVCALLAPSHSWPRVRGLGVCVWARVSAAPRHSWLGCWAVCVLRLHPATPCHGCTVWVCVFRLGFRLRHEDSSFDLAIWCRHNPPSMSEIFTSSTCMPSWVMARRKSLSICMLPWVMARLCAREWVLSRSGSPSWAMDWLGYFSSAMDWLGYLSSAMDWLGSLSWARMGEGLSLRAWTGAGSSLSRHGLGRDHLSLRRDYLSLG